MFETREVKMANKDEFQIGDEVSISLREDGWHLRVRMPKRPSSPKGALVERLAPFKSFNEAVAHLKATFAID
jgi:hypothetical protein